MYFLDPAILFFICGVLAGFLRSNLEIPDQINKFLGIYLLMTLGWKAGVAINDFAYSSVMIQAVLLSWLFSLALPALNFYALKKYLPIYDSAALAATYGSCGAITYLAATQFLRSKQIPYDDFMISCMILMQIPAIAFSVALCSAYRKNRIGGVKQVLYETFTEGTLFVLLCSFVIGLINPDFEIQLAGGETPPFKLDVFRILLSIFLLHMGIQASKQFKNIPDKKMLLLSYAILCPIFHAIFAYFICNLIKMSPSNTFIMIMLCASANYIAVPAVLRTAIPEANAGIYMGLSLGISFPFNLLVLMPVAYYLCGFK